MAAVLLAFMSYPFSDGSVSAPPFGVRPCFLYVACSGGRTTNPNTCPLRECRRLKTPVSAFQGQDQSTLTKMRSPGGVLVSPE